MKKFNEFIPAKSYYSKSILRRTTCNKMSLHNRCLLVLLIQGNGEKEGFVENNWWLLVLLIQGNGEKEGFIENNWWLLVLQIQGDCEKEGFEEHKPNGLCTKGDINQHVAVISFIRVINYAHI